MIPQFADVFVDFFGQPSTHLSLMPGAWDQDPNEAPAEEAKLQGGD